MLEKIFLLQKKYEYEKNMKKPIKSQRIEKSPFFSYAHIVTGEKGEFVLPIDNREGNLIIPSHNPTKFKRIYIKSLNFDSDFKTNKKIYHYDVKNDFLSVNNNIKITKRRR